MRAALKKARIDERLREEAEPAWSVAEDCQLLCGVWRGCEAGETGVAPGEAIDPSWFQWRAAESGLVETRSWQQSARRYRLLAPQLAREMEQKRSTEEVKVLTI